MDKVDNAHRKLEYNYITEGIYVGTNQCCQTHFEEGLRKVGIEADISLEEERVDLPFGVLFYIWIPVRDHQAPTPEQFDFGITTLEKLVAMKKKVYLHCKNGHGRAPTLLVAYLVRQGKSLEEAIELLMSKRPSIHLTDIQKQALELFSQRLK